MPKKIKTSIFNKNDSKKLNSNSLEGHKVLKLAAQLPNPEIIRATIDELLRTFENITQTGLLKIRWQEIKKLQAIIV